MKNTQKYKLSLKSIIINILVPIVAGIGVFLVVQGQTNNKVGPSIFLFVLLLVLLTIGNGTSVVVGEQITLNRLVFSKSIDATQLSSVRVTKGRRGPIMYLKDANGKTVYFAVNLFDKKDELIDALEKLTKSKSVVVDDSARIFFSNGHFA